MTIKEISEGVFKIDGRIATANFVKGQKVYDEDLRKVNGVEYRLWNPYRSKLAAAFLKGMKTMRIAKGSSVLYLGAATGTTCSHISDIVGDTGVVYCVENSERSMRDLLSICDSRKNMMPIFSDARNTKEYGPEVGVVDVLYQDVSARDQASILVDNSQFLKEKGYAYVAIKSQSISVSKNPSIVYKEFLKQVSTVFKTVESIDIRPFDQKHLFVVLQKL
jgi:fibrillarin-like pre-rRNA processing protein